MPHFTIAEVQSRIEELIERAQNGEEIIVTDGPDETPVAKLLAVEPVED